MKKHYIRENRRFAVIRLNYKISSHKNKIKNNDDSNNNANLKKKKAEKTKDKQRNQTVIILFGLERSESEEPKGESMAGCEAYKETPSSLVETVL